MAKRRRADRTEFAVKQLRELLRRYPDDHLEIEGVILDYLGRSQESLADVFELNPLIYANFFAGSNPEMGERLLKYLTQEHPALVADLVQSCKSKYPLVADMLENRIVGAKKHAHHTSALLKNPGSILGYNPRAVVWQISDIHFGVFNKVQKDPRELAFMLGKLAADYPELLPSVVVVCGDVSSTAYEGEFQQFRSFCHELANVLWAGSYPGRILVVPGNHDVSWQADGRADRMKFFASLFSDDSCCITPFGKTDAEFDNGAILVKRILTDPDSAPPFAIVQFRALALDFILLVSGYFSGEVPADVRNSISSLKGADEELYNLLRLDQGGVNQEYLFWLSKRLAIRENLALAVIHHNPIQYGVETCQNRLAPQLMDTLWLRNVPLLFHGHIHLSESKGSLRPVVRNATYPIPAPTLTSITTAGSGRGLNIHLFSEPGETRRVDTIVWPYSESMGFKPEDAFWRYSFSIGNGQLKVSFPE